MSYAERNMYGFRQIVAAKEALERGEEPECPDTRPDLSLEEARRYLRLWELEVKIQELDE